jgi:hypothetical protein
MHGSGATVTFLAVAFLAVLFWLLWGLGLARDLLDASSLGDVTKAGQFGDSFGGLNALFTALAFAGVIWAAVLQRQELELQRKELTETRAVLDRQSEALAQQAFDSIFFEMLSSFRGVSNDVQTTDDRTLDPLLGSIAISKLDRRLMESISTRYPRWNRENDEVVRIDLEKTYFESVYRRDEMYLGPYFRSLYHVFKLIDQRKDLKDEQKVNYANIARANLSKEALLLIATNVCTSLGAEFLPLIENYGVLKHMGREDIRDLFRRFIKEEAFLGYAERKALRIARAIAS